MNGKENSLLIIWLIIDVVLLTMSISIAYCCNIGDVQQTSYSLPFYVFHGVFSWILTYFIFSKKYLYLRNSYKHRVMRILRRTGVFTIILLAMAFFFEKGGYSRIFLISYVGIFLVEEFIAYKLIYIILGKRRENGKSVKRALIVGYTDISVQLKNLFENDSMLGYKFAGFVRYAERNIAEIPEDELVYFVGDTEDLEQIIKKTRAEVVFSVFSFFQTKNKVQQQLIACNHCGVRLYLIPETSRWMRNDRNVESLGNLYILNPQHIPLDDLGNRLLKRGLDLLVSGLFIICVFLWLLPIIAIVVKLSSKGPVFFCQMRTGLSNRTFKCLKFRSMQINDDADEEQATVGDPRITAVGRFMRKTNFDELPQFLNVFVGHMSLVGPRPHMLKHTKEYSKLIESYLARHYVRPGITGWAQVSGYRGETNELWKMEKRVEYDMNYIENWNFWWDIKIMWLTLFGKKARDNAR